MSSNPARLQTPEVQKSARSLAKQRSFAASTIASLASQGLLPEYASRAGEYEDDSDVDGGHSSHRFSRNPSLSCLVRLTSEQASILFPRSLRLWREIVESPYMSNTNPADILAHLTATTQNRRRLLDIQQHHSGQLPHPDEDHHPGEQQDLVEQHPVEQPPVDEHPVDEHPVDEHPVGSSRVGRKIGDSLEDVDTPTAPKLHIRCLSPRRCKEKKENIIRESILPVTLVAIHGLLTGLDNLLPLGRSLAPPLQRFVSLSPRNYESSPWDLDDSSEAHLQDLGRALYEERKRPDCPVIGLLGHSLGGTRSMILSLRRPELVDFLIIFDIAPLSYTDMKLRMALRLWLAVPLMLQHRSGAISTVEDADKAIAAVDPWISNVNRKFILPLFTQPSDHKEQSHGLHDDQNDPNKQTTQQMFNLNYNLCGSDDHLEDLFHWPCELDDTVTTPAHHHHHEHVTTPQEDNNIAMSSETPNHHTVGQVLKDNQYLNDSQNLKDNSVPSYEEEVVDTLEPVTSAGREKCRTYVKVKPFMKPALFLRGGRSPKYMPKSADASILKFFPNATIKLIDGASHLIHMDKPKEVAQVVREWITTTLVPKQ